MKQVPKSFQVMGHTITVRVVSRRDWDALCDEYEDLEDSCGWWIPDQNLIVLLQQPRSNLLHALFHEAAHAWLYYMNSPLWRDEQHVDQLGGLIAQMMVTAT